MQILSAIRQRRKDLTKLRHVEIEWQTKTLASYIAQGIETDSQSSKQKLMDSINQLSLTGNSDEETQETLKTSSAADTSDERSIEDIMMNGNTEAALKKNSARRGGMPFS